MILNIEKRRESKRYVDPRSVDEIKADQDALLKAASDRLERGGVEAQQPKLTNLTEKEKREIEEEDRERQREREFAAAQKKRRQEWINRPQPKQPEDPAEVARQQKVAEERAHQQQLEDEAERVKRHQQQLDAAEVVRRQKEKEKADEKVKETIAVLKTQRLAEKNRELQQQLENAAAEAAAQ